MDWILMADVVFVLGLVLVAAGVGFIYWPASLVFAGASLMFLAYCAANKPAAKLPAKRVPFHPDITAN